MRNTPSAHLMDQWTDLKMGGQTGEWTLSIPLSDYMCYAWSLEIIEIDLWGGICFGSNVGGCNMILPLIFPVFSTMSWISL